MKKFNDIEKIEILEEKIDKLQLLINKFENGKITRDEFNRQKSKLLQN